jgi:hypothetical protein
MKKKKKMGRNGRKDEEWTGECASEGAKGTSF